MVLSEEKGGSRTLLPVARSLTESLRLSMCAGNVHTHDHVVCPAHGVVPRALGGTGPGWSL